MCCEGVHIYLNMGYICREGRGFLKSGGKTKTTGRSSRRRGGSDDGEPSQPSGSDPREEDKDEEDRSPSPLGGCGATHQSDRKSCHCRHVDDNTHDVRQLREAVQHLGEESGTAVERIETLETLERD